MWVFLSAESRELKKNHLCRFRGLHAVTMSVFYCLYNFHLIVEPRGVPAEVVQVTARTRKRPKYHKEGGGWTTCPHPPPNSPADPLTLLPPTSSLCRHGGCKKVCLCPGNVVGGTKHCLMTLPGHGSTFLQLPHQFHSHLSPPFTAIWPPSHQRHRMSQNTWVGKTH